MIGLVVGLLLATGAALPGLEAYDELMTSLLRKWDVAGAGLAVARGDKLVLVRGYGFADIARLFAEPGMGPAYVQALSARGNAYAKGVPELPAAIDRTLDGERLELRHGPAADVHAPAAPVHGDGPLEENRGERPGERLHGLVVEPCGERQQHCGGSGKA